MAAEDRRLQDLFALLRSNSSTGPRPPSTSFSPQQSSFNAQQHASQQRPGSENNNINNNNNNPFSPLNNVAAQSRIGQTMAGSAHGTHQAQSSSPLQTANPDRSASLLNLLKYNQASSSAQQQQQQSHQQQQQQSPAHSPAGATRVSFLPPSQQAPSPAAQTFHGRGVSASDLVASFMGKPQTPTMHSSASPAPVVEPTPVSSANPQDYLLQLLNRSQSSPAARPSQNTAQAVSSPGVGGAPASVAEPAQYFASTTSPRPAEGITAHSHSPVPAFVTTESKEPIPLEPSQVSQLPTNPVPPTNPIFTYVNPFEQLAASSPRNRSGAATPQKELPQLSRFNSAADVSKSKGQPRTSAISQQSFNNDLTANGSEVLRSVESPDPPPLTDGRSKVEALIGIGAPTTDTETVSQALNNVGEQVSQQVDNALAEADAKEATRAAEGEKQAEEEVDHQLQKVASDVKEELEQPENKGALEAVFDKQTADAVKEVLDEAVGGHGSADDEKSSGHADEDYTVPVHNFPMKPFASIELTQDQPPQAHFRENVITDIARLKKEFDQIDRTLATASGEYIMYAMPKPGGVRVIRQEDGIDRQIFKETKDHVFNVALSTAPRGKNTYDLQSSIATAISGTVYWTALYYGGDNIEAENIQQHCLVFPPISAHEDHTSGGQLKTRAKKSNRHPEFFAIGRGKSIQVIFPLHAAKSDFVGPKSVVDTEAYFKARSLRINTGKAGKDFAFSEDDSVIATLDKAGRLRFWDVRELVHESNNAESKLAPVEIRTSLLTFPTSMPNEKSWPTSVLFVDKLRAYAKGVAQRYVLVGLKQNHILQLWDLGIGKVIQEVYFPHSKESDAICSVAYHPTSGIIVVGHPTRNSIYFIHLSAPKYNLSGMTQARYLAKLVDKDPSLPKPEATAIMSGMREISFASKGQLRSLDLLPMSNESSALKEEPGLFELYVMHSKGVTYLNINRLDLGWSEDNKVIYARDAEAAGMIKIKELVQPPLTIVSESSSVNGDVALRQPSSAPAKEIIKKQTPATPAKAAETLMGVVEAGEPETPSKAQNGASEKPEKRKKKKNAAASVVEDSSAVPPAAPMAPPATPSNATAAAKSPTPVSVAQSVTKESSRPSKRRPVSPARSMDAESVTLGVSSEFLDKELKKIEEAVSAQFSKTLGKELESLYDRFSEDKRVLQAQSGAQQEAILRLVSSSLGDNVEKSLKKIVSNSIQENVVPAINQITASTIQKELPSFMSSHVLKSLPGTVKQALTETVHTTIQKPDVLRVLSNEVTAKVSAHVEKQFSVMFESTVIPAFKDLTLGAAAKMATEAEQRVSQQLDRANLQHREDSGKIEQLTNVVRALSETVQSMAEAQSDFQKEILRLQQQQQQQLVPRTADTQSSPAYADTIVSKPTPDPETTAEMRELEEIKATMAAGNFQEGTVLVSYDSIKIENCEI